MRQKLLEKGGTALTDLEILEMLLYASAPRGDTKPLAKRLVKIFKSLPEGTEGDADRVAGSKGYGRCGNCRA